MSNAKEFISLCTSIIDNSDVNKIIEFNNRSKKQYLKNFKQVPLYFLIILLFFVIIFGIFGKEINSLKILLEIYPIVILISSVFIFVWIILCVYYIKRYYKFDEKIRKIESLKKCLNGHKLLYKDIEFTANDTKMTIVCFMQIDSDPIIKYEVGLEHPNVEYDKLIENHIYNFYSINDKKLFIIDDIYN